MNREILSVEPKRISDSHNSKGNQWKWCENKYWYKSDFLGYEGLSEVVASEFMTLSNFAEGEYTKYEPVCFEYNGKEYVGCKSPTFLKQGQDIITLERLYKSCTSFGLAKTLGRMGEVEDRILHVVDFMERVIGLEGYGATLTKLIEADTFFCNEDRHTNNIAIINNFKTGERAASPIFDMGSGLFSDTTETYPIHFRAEECMAAFKSKPFSENADMQLDILQRHYGDYLRFNMTQSEARSFFDVIVKKHDLDSVYSDKILRRVDDTLRMQIRKFGYLWNAT